MVIFGDYNYDAITSSHLVSRICYKKDESLVFFILENLTMLQFVLLVIEVNNPESNFYYVGYDPFAEGYKFTKNIHDCEFLKKEIAERFTYFALKEVI